MDGVLCDFLNSVSELTDRPVDSLSVSQLWELTRNTNGFWENLNWMPGSRELWSIIDSYHGHILSSLAYSDPSSKVGKLVWLDINLKLTDLERIHLVSRRRDKRNFAVSELSANILIDDYIKNIEDWEAAGGIGIHHSTYEDSIVQLENLGFGPMPYGPRNKL